MTCDIFSCKNAPSVWECASCSNSVVLAASTRSARWARAAAAARRWTRPTPRRRHPSVRSPAVHRTRTALRAPAHYRASAEGMLSNNWEIFCHMLSHFKDMFERETFSYLNIAFLVRLFHKKHNWCCDIFNTYKYLVHVCIIFVLYIIISIVARISDLVMQLNSNRNLVCFEHTDPLFYLIFLFKCFFTFMKYIYNVFY